MQKIFKEFKIKKLIPTPEQIKDIFNSRLRNEEQPEGICFMQAFDEFVSERGVQNSWTHSTYEKFAAVKNHLLEFNPSVSELFDEVGLNKYVLYLRDKRKMRNSTIENQLSFLKWFLRWSFGKGYTTHVGRRTFICNALSLGIPANVVMKWTGHSDYKAMKPYIDIADDIKANAMNKFDQL